MRLLTICAVLAGALPAAAVPLTFEVTVPADTPAGAEIHLAGNFQGWQPGSADWRLQRRDDGVWTITADFAAEQGLQFKFTLGSWLSVEKGPGGGEIANRLHKVTGPETLRLEVAGWADGQPEQRADTIAGHVETITVPGFLGGRRVWVYLPPGYVDAPDKRYPVLYMCDGQNVFNDATSFVGEWRVDETLEELIPAGRVAALIVVAVDNGRGERTDEYTPWPIPGRVGSGGGSDHLQAWIEVLKPHIDAHYRTRAEADQTGIAGSSLGGLMALYGSFAHPDVFGRAGSFSPSLLIAGRPAFDLCAEAPAGPATLYVDMGSREEGNLVDKGRNGIDDYVDALARLTGVLQVRGYVGGWDLMTVVGDGDRHNEEAWARRFGPAVEFLFPPE